MLEIDDRNRITLTRGDSAILKLYLRDSQNKSISIQNNFICVLTIKENANTDKILVQIKAENGKFCFTPDDTNKLSYGDYLYDIQVTVDESDVYTVIPPTRFTIGEEITW